MNKLPIDFLPIIVLIAEECRFQYVICSNSLRLWRMVGAVGADAKAGV